MPEDLVCLSHLAVGIRVPETSASPQSIRETSARVLCRGAGSYVRRAEMEIQQCPESGVNICVPADPEET